MRDQHFIITIAMLTLVGCASHSETRSTKPDRTADANKPAVRAAATQTATVARSFTAETRNRPAIGVAATQWASITRSFPAEGIKKIVIRAAEVQSATVTVGMPNDSITISGVPSGGARGYHSHDPNWQETPADRWGLDFVSQRYGDVLVISTSKEIHYIHHRYVLDSLRIEIPTSVEVVRQARQLNGRGEPDLSPP